MSNITIQQFIGKNKHPDIERLFGYSQYTWMKLLSHAAFTRILTMSGVSLVLFSQRVRTIANTRNNKARRKYILSLLEYTESVNPAIAKPRDEDYSMSPLTCWLSEVMGVLGFNSIPTDVTVRYVTCSNASDIAAVTVGDSKHFISCLRSGVQRYVSKLLRDEVVAKSELTLEWYRTTTDCDVDLLAGYSGCNSHYIEHEVKAFDEGKVFYVIVGNMVYEDHEGPRARVRVHVVDDDELGMMYVVDDVYGDKLLVTSMYKDLHETYPGRVYSTKGSCVPNNIITSRESIQLDDEFGVYSDHLPCGVYQVIDVADFVPAIKLSAAKHVSGVRWHIRNTYKGDLHITWVKSKVKPSTSIVPNDEYINRMRGLFPSNAGLYYFHSGSHNWSPIVAAISKYYSLPCVNSDGNRVSHLLTHRYSRVVQSGSTLVWEIRGYTYTLEYDCTFESVTLTRYKSASSDDYLRKVHVYNLKTGKWVHTRCPQYLHARRQYWCSSDTSAPYNVTRHTVHLIYRLMPKPNARVHTMPKL